MKDIDLIHDFVLESLDLLDSAEPRLVELQHLCEATGDIDNEMINAVFRLFHSMKGGAGMLNLQHIQALTHTAETLLDLFRKGTLRVDLNHTDVLLRSADLIKRMLERTNETCSDEGFEDAVQALVSELDCAIKGTPPSKPSASRDEQTAPQAQPKANDAANDLGILITDEMITRFINEALDLLDQAEHALMDFEQQRDPEIMQKAFRSIHSFKGNCGFMGHADLERLSHKMESVLDGIRTQSVDSHSEIFGTLLQCVDVLRSAVACISRGESGDIDNVDLYIDFLGDLVAKHPASPAEQPAPIEVPASAPAAAEAEPAGPEPVSEITVTKDTKKPATPPPPPSQTIVRQDIRVDLQKLDSLINLVGELVIAEAMVTRHPAITSQEDESVERAVHQLRRVSRDLQDVAMSVRMIPLAGTFQKMIRLVHDLSNKSGKKINLEISGEDTEVDKTVIENISDPIVHIVRNAIDHGVESPQERSAAGKPEVACLKIEGRHEGGEVWITISDDGKGLNRARILKKGIERGLVRGDGADLTDSQVYKLIFEPGFSTADKVTDISGRGVGMDVVKKNIEKLKGKVDIRSVPGEGAAFILRIPLTLAIIDGMLVRVGRSRYIIPILAIRESIKPDLEHVTITPDGSEVVRVRDDFYPVVRLHELFKQTADSSVLSDGILVIVETEGQVVALFVDEILGQQETVIKGLSSYFEDVKGVSGCTILGNGEVSLILDVSAVAGVAHNAASVTV